MSRTAGIPAAVVLLLSALLFTGCVSSYRNTELRSSMNDTERKINEMAAAVETFTNDLQAGYDQLSAQLGAAKEPFPQMLSSLQKISATADKLNAARPAIAGIIKDFEAIVATLPIGQNIRSDKPGWEEFKPVRARFEALLEELNNSIDDANDAQNSLNDLAKKHGMGKANAAEMKSQAASLISGIEQNKAALAEKISPADKEAVERKQNELQQLSGDLDAGLGEKAEVWVMPGSSVNVKFDAIRKKGEEAAAILSKVK